MNHTRWLYAAMLSGAFMLTGCDRETTPSTRELAGQAERQVEKAGAVLDDATITARIKTALIAAPGLTGTAIDVDTSQNVVSLSGTVLSDAARKEAEDIARKTEGVKEVRNNLTIKPAG